MKQKQNFLSLFLCFGFLSLLSACGGVNKSSELLSVPTNPGEVEYHPYDVNNFQLNKIVCDPMGTPGNPGPGDGLIASLFYLESNQPKYTQVSDYMEFGTKSTQKLFFSQLNVPTRVFDQGFPSQTGSLLQNDQNEDLIEHFGLRFRSVLTLAPSDEEGDYELALLSDDGAVLKIMNSEGEFETVVDNDKVHPTRMGCGDVVTFNKATEFDVEIDYYQGPRYHISLIPMWRKVDANTPAEVECGKQGNSRYFDFNNNSQPKQKYLDMLARGWKPIAAENWHLPPMAITNPCVQGTDPKISNFQIQDIGGGFVSATWETDIPATSQVRVVDPQGQERVTQSDNVLRTSHSVRIPIVYNQVYDFQGISISADMGKSLSRVIQLRVFRSL